MEKASLDGLKISSWPPSFLLTFQIPLGYTSMHGGAAHLSWQAGHGRGCGLYPPVDQEEPGGFPPGLIYEVMPGLGLAAAQWGFTGHGLPGVDVGP